jgi:hypothetical protein
VKFFASASLAASLFQYMRDHAFGATTVFQAFQCRYFLLYNKPAVRDCGQPT